MLLKQKQQKSKRLMANGELVDTLDALTESIGAYTLHGIHFAHLLESVKDFKMDMKIEKTIRQRLNTTITLITLLKLSTLSQQKLEARLKKNSKKVMYDSHEGFG